MSMCMQRDNYKKLTFNFIKHLISLNNIKISVSIYKYMLTHISVGFILYMCEHAHNTHLHMLVEVCTLSTYD